MATRYHAEHVGSLLRPRWLRDARAAHKQGRLPDEELRKLEDRAAAEAIELQRQAGIEVFTDGEVRRDTWMAALLEDIGGVAPARLPPVTWHREGGSPPTELFGEAGWTGSCWSTTASGPAVSSRCGTSGPAPRSCSAWSPPRCRGSSRRMSCGAASMRRRGTCQPRTSRSARSAGSPPPPPVTC